MPRGTHRFADGRPDFRAPVVNSTLPSYDGVMEPARQTTEQRLTIVPDELQAEMVRAVLESHDIRCVVRRTALGELQWGVVNTGMGGPREIVVDGDDLAAARDVLAATEAALPPEADPHDPTLLADRAVMRRGFTTFAVLLFGIPIVLGILGLLASIADGMG